MSRAVVQSQPAIFPLVILVPLPRLRTHMAKKLMTTQSTLALWCLFPCGSDTWPLCHAPRYGWSHRHAPGSTLWAGELRQGFSQEASRLGQGWCSECKLLGWTGLFYSVSTWPCWRVDLETAVLGILGQFQPKSQFPPPSCFGRQRISLVIPPCMKQHGVATTNALRPSWRFLDCIPGRTN